MLRKLRTDATETSYMIQGLINPPQAGHYRDLQGDLFPETYPFQDPVYQQDRFFYTKYHVS